VPGAAVSYLQVVPQFSLKKAGGIEKGAVKAMIRPRSLSTPRANEALSPALLVAARVAISFLAITRWREVGQAMARLG